MTEDEMEIVRGSGNIYADLGHPDADAKLMKAELAADIIATLDRRKLTAREGEALTGITAADLSRIRNADLGRFTIDRLIRVANALGAGRRSGSQRRRQHRRAKLTTMDMGSRPNKACRCRPRLFPDLPPAGPPARTNHLRARCDASPK